MAKQQKIQLTKEAREKRRLQNKLARTISSAGLSWISYSAIVEIGDEIEGMPVESACWYFDPNTKKEKIVISTKLMKEMPVNLLALTLKHELLHKAMYRKINKKVDFYIINLALDACIEKIQFLSHPTLAIKRNQYYFPEDKKERLSELSVRNPSIRTDEVKNIPKKIREIFKEIYYSEAKKQTMADCYNKTRGSHWNIDVPDPMTLYNKLQIALSKKQKKQIQKYYEIHLALQGTGGKTSGIPSDVGEDPNSKQKGAGQDNGNGKKKKKKQKQPRGGKGNKRCNNRATLKMEREAAAAIEKGLGFCQGVNFSKYFKQFVYTKRYVEADGLSNFIKEWETTKQIEGVTQSIYSTIAGKATIDPIPTNLNRTGIELVALGVCGPEQIPLYFNNNSPLHSKKKICCYFDVSPSMHEFIPYMVHIADFFNGCEECEISGGEFNGKYSFAGTVKGMTEAEWQNFRKGVVNGGCATSFENVVLHAMNQINEDEVDIIIVFTDGESGISQKTIDMFNATGKKCYPIYFCNPNYTWGWRHSRNGQDKSTMDALHSDLDKLTGENFTVWCSPNAKKEVI